jgi:hypothetical protein
MPMLKAYHTKLNGLWHALVELERETRPTPYVSEPPPMTEVAWLGLMVLGGIILGMMANAAAVLR